MRLMQMKQKPVLQCLQLDFIMVQVSVSEYGPYMLHSRKTKNDSTDLQKLVDKRLVTSMTKKHEYHQHKNLYNNQHITESDHILKLHTYQVLRIPLKGIMLFYGLKVLKHLIFSSGNNSFVCTECMFLIGSFSQQTFSHVTVGNAKV